MGSHSRRGVSKRRNQAGAIVAAASSEGIGIFLITWGNHLAAQDYYYDVGPWGIWSAFFVAAPLLALAVWVIAGMARAVAAERRRYREWKASLPPGQRMAVELAEAAALTAAAIVMHEWHKRADARLTSSVMGFTMPDGHTSRPSQRIASYRQQAPRALAISSWDLTAASQAVIARHHPEYLNHATGSYTSVPTVSGKADVPSG